VGVSEQHERYVDLCAAAALGSIDRVDRELLEEHLASGCAECEAALADFSGVVALLAASVPPAQPSPALRGRVLEAAAQTRQTPAALELRPQRRAAGVRWLPSALAAGLAVAAIAGWSRVSDLAGRLGAAEQSLAETRRRLDEEQSWAALLGSTSTCVVPLQLTADGRGDLRARAIYEPVTQRAVVLVDKLKAPDGRAYQLWAIHGSQPQSLGLIRTDAAGHAVLRLERLGDKANAFAISLEPAGGAPTSDKPTGPVVLLGSVPA
jgi:anti-sigma-K factor RskA